MFASDILQVLSNLVLNALDALPTEGPCITIRLRMRHDAVHIAVSDNGGAFLTTIRKTLFAPYMTTKQAGTGLGLWLSRLIADKHGGQLRVHSSQVEPARSSPPPHGIHRMLATMSTRRRLPSILAEPSGQTPQHPPHDRHASASLKGPYQHRPSVARRQSKRTPQQTRNPLM